MKTRHRHADVIHAWAEGEEIEFRTIDVDYWRPVDWANPVWFEGYEYRVKPKIVRREGWIALYHKDSEGFPACCGIYATQDECQRMNGTARIVRIEWEEEVENGT